MIRTTHQRVLAFVGCASVLYVASVLARGSNAGVASHEPRYLLVNGGGETVLLGGNGAQSLQALVPALTKFAFRVEKPVGGVPQGRFECLALAPESVSGSGSGDFSENIMYFSGIATDVELLDRHEAVITGVGRCTNLGEGEGIDFEARVTSGGPGQGTIRLTVSSLPGLVFEEIVSSGVIEIWTKRPRR